MVPYCERFTVLAFRALSAAAIVAQLLWVVFALFKGFSSEWWIPTLILTNLACLFLVGARHRRMCGYVRILLERRCVNCDYMLGPLPDGHRCPECGTTIDTVSVRRYLARMLRLKDFEEQEQG